MARQRKSVPESRNSSSSNGSSDFKVMAPPRKPLWAYYKELLIGPAVVIIVVCTVMGYQQTRVNTPFDAKRVVTRTGLEVPEQFWGSYRPGVYFGLKTRDPHSLVMGLMWYFPYRLGPGIEGIRHWCDQGDNLESYGWIQHDGSNFGVQEIRDGPFKLTTSFVKRVGGENGGDWTARVAVEVLPEFQGRVQPSEQISLIWYTALDEGEGSIALTNSNTQMTGIKGSTDTLGDFKLTLVPQQGKVDHESFVSTRASGLHLLKETVISSLRLAADKTKQAKKIVLGGEIRPAGDEKKPPNFVAIQTTAKLPFSIDVVFESASVVNRKDQLVGASFTKALQWQTSRFSQRFETKFHLKDKGFSQKQIQFAQATLSNMLGGIGYFYGSSSVQSIYTDVPVDYWKAPLFTAVPSRSFFPRGFLWDEGFHGLLIAQWDVDLELDIIAHWFDLMNAEGWIPREQILGVEALAKVPKEFVVQRNTNANPPTFFLTLQYILQKYAADLTNERLMVLERLYPRLQAWYHWFNSTQKGLLLGSFRWRGRDSLMNRELNPKTLTSGMDDYPRASHPTDLERHVDLYCWMAVASETMAKLAYILGRDASRKYRETANFLMDNQLLIQLHWSNFSRRFADYGLHTDSVKLVRPTPLPRQPNQNMEMIRQVLKQPEYRLVDSVFGYGNIFPFLLQILQPTSPQLGQIIADIRDPNLMWTEYGLRSLAKTAPLYMERNTEHDPPYWRGQIWININFLAAKALHHYAHIEGPHQSKAREVYGDQQSYKMSREKQLLLRVQSSEGTKRVEISPSATTCQLFETIHDAFNLNSFTFALYKQINKKDEIASSKSKTLRALGLKHGDMIYMSSLDGSVLFNNNTSAGEPVAVAGPSTSNVSRSNIAIPVASKVPATAKSNIKEDDVDILLYKLDGRIERTRDDKLCRHNANSKCVHCSSLEPFDEAYLKEHNIKHLSFHSYLRKMMSGVDRGKFLALEDISCSIKAGCKDHPPWPKGICSKCQPNAITLNMQAYRHIDNVAFENTNLVEKFLNYWRASGHQRIGYLYGNYEVHTDVPLGIRANVVAIYEPPQESSRDSIRLLVDEKEDILRQISSVLGIMRVGWIFTDLVPDDIKKGTVKHTRNVDSHFLSSQECIMAGYLQNLHPNACKYASSGNFGSKFVTVCVTGDKSNQVHMEGYQVSNQCMALVRDNCLVPTKDAAELGYVRESTDKQYVPDVYYKEKDSYGNEVSRLARPLPVEYLLVDVPASTPVVPTYTFNSDPSKEPFPVENRFVDGHIQDFNALSTYLQQFAFDEFYEAINDFHLLLYIATMDMLPMRENLEPLLEALKNKDRNAAVEWSRTEQWATLEQLIAASSPPPSRPGSVAATDTSPARTGPKWPCPFCTFINEAEVQTCAMCNLPRSRT